MFEHFKFLRTPIPETHSLLARFILEDEAARRIFDPPDISLLSRVGSSSSSSDDLHDLSQNVPGPLTIVDQHIDSIVEFVTASNWPATFDYLRSVIMKIRGSPSPQGGTVPTAAVVEDERTSLTSIALFSNIWLDGQKLSLVLQEMCSNFLHFSRPFQNSVSQIMPVVISRWFQNCPDEFTKLHFHHNKISGADTFFDMAQTIVESGRRKLMLLPMQMCLLLLQPEVFEVACNFRDTKSGALAKKVAFLENLRKAARNGNDTAVFCLVGSIRATRFLVPQGEESGLVSYSLDIQDELRDIVFNRSLSGTDGVLFDQDMVTVTFISLTELNFATFAKELTDICLHPSAPLIFQIALVQACNFFSRHHQTERFRPLLRRVVPFVCDQLKVNILYFLHTVPLLICIGYM